jgi:hypothetical protein
MPVRRKIYLIVLVVLITSTNVFAGPPWDTDDPVPTDFQHWEIFCSSMGSESAGAWAGTAPHVEANYGAVPNVQLSVTIPLCFYSVEGGKTNYGYGDTEFGIKYRFIKKDSGRLHVSVYPSIQVPTGNAEEGLGNGNTQLYIPIWIERVTGKWTTNGGGGYWINPGAGNKNYEFAGVQTQYQCLKNVSIGGELNYITASLAKGNPVDASLLGNTSNEFNFNIGALIDISDESHIIFSVGRSIVGNINLQWYAGYWLTI